MTQADRGALASLKGARLVGVTYHYLPPADEAGYAGGEKGVDTDLAAVDLDLGERGTVAFTWAMDGFFHGLGILKEPYVGLATEILDAADRNAWREHMGDRIASVAASWQVSGEGCPESIWAIRISFAVGSIVIALGWARPDIEFMPDEIVVIGDTSLARSYKPQHVSESSWGSSIEPT